MPLDLVDVIDAADIRVGDVPRHPYFRVELGQTGGIAIDVRRQELEGDRLPELEVVGAEDLTHPAAAEPADRPVAAAEDGARREPSMVDRA
jgi:hypothetical protein